MVFLAMDHLPLSMTTDMPRAPSLNLSSMTSLDPDVYIQTPTVYPLLGTHRHTPKTKLIIFLLQPPCCWHCMLHSRICELSLACSSLSSPSPHPNYQKSCSLRQHIYKLPQVHILLSIPIATILPGAKPFICHLTCCAGFLCSPSHTPLPRYLHTQHTQSGIFKIQTF